MYSTCIYMYSTCIYMYSTCIHVHVQYMHYMYIFCTCTGTSNEVMCRKWYQIGSTCETFEFNIKVHDIHQRFRRFGAANHWQIRHSAILTRAGINRLRIFWIRSRFVFVFVIFLILLKFWNWVLYTCIPSEVKMFEQSKLITFCPPNSRKFRWISLKKCEKIQFLMK